LDGPRHPTALELDAIAELNDRVFFNGKEREMFRRWPATFCADNLRNLFVCVENGRLLSHTAINVRDVLIEGAATRMAALGSVCTDDAARGRGLATACVEMACDQAHEDGCDFVYISGGLPIYRRLGAVDCGIKYTVTVDEAAAQSLAAPGIDIAACTPGDIPDVAYLHAQSATRFLRPRDDWEVFFSSGMCLNRFSSLWRIRRDGHDAAYAFLTHEPNDEGVMEIIECGGEASAIAGALERLYQEAGRPLRLHFGGHETALAERLQAGGAHCQRTWHDFGTTLLLDAPRLVQRMQPVFAQRAGLAFARTVSAEVDGDRFTFHAGGESLTLEGRGPAARFVFGHPEDSAPAGALGKAFPLAAPWYGLNYL